MLTNASILTTNDVILKARDVTAGTGIELELC